MTTFVRPMRATIEARNIRDLERQAVKLFRCPVHQIAFTPLASDRPACHGGSFLATRDPRWDEIEQERSR